MSDQSQRTEEATPRRRNKAREEGQFPTSREFVSAMQFLVFVMAVAAWGQDWVQALKEVMRMTLAEACRLDDGCAVALLGARVLAHAFRALVPLGVAVLAATVATQLAVTGMGTSLKKLAPDVKRLNPLSKLRELPRQNIPAAIQAALLLPVFGALIWGLARESAERYALLPLAGVTAGAQAVGESTMRLLWKAAAGFLVFGAVDLVRQLRRYTKDLRMSKQEIRDEAKETDGNPQIKSRVRRLQRDAARKRMMKAVPQATAVVVNPTHYAVALRYSMDGTGSPLVVAKGKNWLALRIRQVAVENQVPIVENPPLAQALYKAVDVGQEIPVQLYRAVAEILAYVYRMMRGTR